MNPPPVQYVRTSDGYDIAYRVLEGAGPPLVFVPPPLIDIDRVWQWFPDWMEGLAKRFRLIQYDLRGQGFSTRNLPAETTMDGFYRDLEAVVARAGAERFFIWAWAASGHLAVRYAVDHADRVAGLILNSCRVSALAARAVQFAMLPQENWDLFLRTIAPPDLAQEETRLRVRDFKESMSSNDWDVWVRAFRDSDVSAELPRVRVPALVVHPRRWRLQPAEESMRFAASIPDARFQLIDGNYIYGQADQGLAAIDAFLSDLDVSPPAYLATDTSRPTNGLSIRELEVLRLVAAGKSNPQIAEELVISLNTVQRHVSNILAKTGLSNRTEAASFATRNGLT
jgi:pimeloyl-ACP methyl ester carboxylesterase/DNA-binding CsgD family transcriptional regulator